MRVTEARYIYTLGTGYLVSILETTTPNWDSSKLIVRSSLSFSPIDFTPTNVYDGRAESQINIITLVIWINGG